MRRSFLFRGFDPGGLTLELKETAAMIRIFDEMNRLKLQSKMILQIHDELLFDVLPNEKEKLVSLVREQMENAYTLCIPLSVDISSGDNWVDAHE